MKKNIIITLSLLSIIIIVICIGSYLNKSKNIDLLKNKTMAADGSLSMMLETEVGSKEYIPAGQNKWPAEGYLFNETLSACENGSELTWNEDEKKVLKRGSLPDRCTIYFDKYTLPSITSYEITNTENSISISLTSAPGSNEIKQYRYSIDNGESFVDSTSTSYTFSDLQLGTYNLYVYIEDTLGRKSKILTKLVYVLAKPTSPTLAFDSSYNVLISGSTSENGAVEYYYSLDNKNFTKGNTVSVSSSSTIYAYSLDEMNQKSDVVSKNVTLSDATNGTITTSYYCSKTSSYQSSSTCSYGYSATSTATSYSCSSGYVNGSSCYSSRTYVSTSSSCSSLCDSFYNLTPYYQNGKIVAYWCSCYIGPAQGTYTYSCPNGGSLSGTYCYNATYTGTLKYKCLNTYYDTNEAATAACVNYCATGTYYNGKCYKLS